MSVQQGLARVRQRIADACEAAGRPLDSVELVAVSKRHNAAAIEAAYEAGQRVFGENYVQELEGKAASLAHLDIRWRMIGHLQRNKVKKVLATQASVDTVDSLRLAETISRQSVSLGRQTEVLIQVNIGREPQKSGVMPDGLGTLISGISQLEGIKVAGLMAIPPAGEDALRHFDALRELQHAHRLKTLSMGMSGDLEQAIAAGATLVRVGTAIFGARS